ncbi:MAG: DNA-binding response regulator [Calditrichaeota bacterium]|nr:MAG: DNA-binding response regulator [Calditrichota bacterium]
MNEQFTIYIVEDDPDITEIVEDNLWKEGFRIRTFADGAKAYDAIMSNPPDLILLDLNLPSMSGIELCKYIRAEEITRDIPVIMLTARTEEIDKLIGFEVGADDYITKPFSPRELLARVKVHLRRTRKIAFEEFRQDHLRVNFSTHQVFVNDQPIELTPIQFKILKQLIQAEGRVVSRQTFLDAIWGENYHGDPRTVDVHITRLRERIDPEGKLILTVKGAGYRWNRR